MPAWLDFNWIKDNASFEAVALHYKLALTGKGNQRKARCPFHDDTKPSLQVNFDKGVFHCFGCGASGNILDFVMKVESCGIRDAAHRILEVCKLEAPRRSTAAGETSVRPKATREDEGATKPSSQPRTRGTGPPARSLQASAPALSSRVNAPLTFRLNLDLDAALPYLTERGVDRDTAEEFTLGVASRGLMAGRLSIPIHNREGVLVAYAGRFLGDPPEDAEKYLLPPKFTKTWELFNLHRALALAADHLVVVEGYFGAIRLHRLGHPAVALMGSSISEEQVATILGTGRTPFVMTDGDEPGVKAAGKVTCALASRVPTRFVPLLLNEQPDTIAEEFLNEHLPQPIG